MKKKYGNYATLFTALLAGILFTGCTANEEKETGASWVSDTFESMTPDMKIGQVFCFTVDPIHYFTDPTYKQDINNLLRKYRPGAILLSTNLEKWKPETLSEFNAEKLFSEITELHELQDIPLLIGADFEDGAWFWDKGATRFPFLMALGTTRSASMAYRQGQITAAEAKAQGISIVFAPVLNTVNYFTDQFKFRSLGDSIEAISDLGLNFVKGCQEIGVVPCIKYFPTGNTDYAGGTPPDADYQIPFKRCIDAGVRSVMLTPRILGAGNDAASTVELQDVIGTVLRKNLGFEGLVISMIDEDHNASITDAQRKQHATRCLEAGCTMLILPETTDVDIPFIDHLFLDAEDGKLEMKTIDDSVTRILNMKNSLDLQFKPTLSSIRQVSAIGFEEYHNVAFAMADSSITLLKNDDNILPFNYDRQYIISICFADENSVIEAAYYHKYIAGTYKNIRNITVIGAPTGRIETEVMRRVSEADAVICVFFIKPCTTEERLTKEAKALIRNILNANKRTAAISFYSPYFINEFPGFKGFIITYSPTEQVMKKAIETVFGINNPRGTLPAAISDRFPEGYGLQYNRKQETVMPSSNR